MRLAWILTLSLLATSAGFGQPMSTQFVSAYSLVHLPEETIHNIELGIDKLGLTGEGLILPPGEEFDFLKRIDYIDPEGQSRAADGRGFLSINGIVGNGLSMVAAALFEVAAKAGLEIIEWRPHGSLILPTYDQHRGLDATIWQEREELEVPDPADINMVFVNDTDYSYLLRALSTGGCLVVSAMTETDNLRSGEILIDKLSDLDYQITLRAKEAGQKIRETTIEWQYKRIIYH